jgi:pimeloyl-ACP methyl ester carboxylesterase
VCGWVEYARTDDGAHLAYRILDQCAACDGPVDIVMVSGGLFPMEVYEDDPGFVRLLEGLCSVGRVVVFDRRGLGLSDPIVDWNRPVLDQWADDLSAVVASSGTTNPVVFAWDGKDVATRFAAARRARLRQLVLYQPVTRPDDGWDEWVATQLGARRGNLDGEKTDFLEKIAPSHASDASFREWYTRAGQLGASPTTAALIWESAFSSRPADQLLDRVETPTLVLYRCDDASAPAEAALLVADQISGATVVELDGGDHFPFLGDVDAVVAEIAHFVVGERRLPPVGAENVIRVP